MRDRKRWTGPPERAAVALGGLACSKRQRCVPINRGNWGRRCAVVFRVGVTFQIAPVRGGNPWFERSEPERPRHVVELAPYRIARTPMTNASWLGFTEGGGYRRREWWSDEGWSWKEEYDIDDCPSSQTGHPDAPVCHLSWFEADAFARGHGLRLPTEAEWERAATWSPETLLHGVGSVWEWTATEFAGYPGFVAKPYREYSEVFFDRGYRVLRGWSRATHPQLASRSFRNWDLPPATSAVRRHSYGG